MNESSGAEICETCNAVTHRLDGDGKSIAFKSGAEACKSGVKLKDSAIRKLRVGCQQYDDYIAGYDSIANQK